MTDTVQPHNNSQMHGLASILNDPDLGIAHLVKFEVHSGSGAIPNQHIRGTISNPEMTSTIKALLSSWIPVQIAHHRKQNGIKDFLYVRESDFELSGGITPKLVTSLYEGRQVLGEILLPDAPPYGRQYAVVAPVHGRSVLVDILPPSMHTDIDALAATVVNYNLRSRVPFYEPAIINREGRYIPHYAWNAGDRKAFDIAQRDFAARAEPTLPRADRAGRKYCRALINAMPV